MDELKKESKDYYRIDELEEESKDSYKVDELEVVFKDSYKIFPTIVQILITGYVVVCLFVIWEIYQAISNFFDFFINPPGWVWLSDLIEVII